MRTTEDHKVSVFEYDNYRQFLKEAYSALKTKDKKFSFRYFSKSAGFKSSSVLKMIIDGKRNMGSSAIDQFARALKLNDNESAFFRILVLFNQARSLEEKQSYARTLMHFQDFRKSHPLAESQYNFYTLWYIPVVWELASLPGFRDDPEWIAKRIHPAISPAEAKKAVNELFKLGLFERKNDGTVIKSKTNLRTPDEVSSSSVAQWHIEMMKKAAQSIDSVPREKRDISSITCAMSEETARKIKEKIQKFRKELIIIASQDQSPTVVYQANFQFFPQAWLFEDELK